MMFTEPAIKRFSAAESKIFSSAHLAITGKVCDFDRVALLGPGEVIGESALRRGKLRSATVTTTGPAEVLRIERDDLARLLDEIPALRETMDVTAARHTPVCPRPADEAETETL